MNPLRTIGRIALLAALLGGPAQSSDDNPYSGKDLRGIESIVADIERGSESWRREAEERIRARRMADLTIEVRSAATGKPIPGVSVRVKLLRHAFRFGGIVDAPTMANGGPALSAEQYRALFLECFNAAGFNNALKYKLRNSQERYVPEQLAWFKQHNIPVRGHCLIWPGRDHLSAEMARKVEECRARPSVRTKNELRQLCEEQIAEWAAQWDVVEWDVINEPRGNRDIAELLGEEILADWFKTARRHTVNPEARLYLNENRIISDPSGRGVLTPNIRKYLATVEMLLKEGAPLGGFGFQSRFHTLLPAETLYERLSLFEPFGLPVTATEFEIADGISGELNKAVMAERVLTVYFSHPLVEGIYAWTLLPSPRSEELDRHIFAADGTPNLRGKIWLYLVKNRWSTDETLSTDSDGRAALRAFLGDLEIAITSGTEQKTLRATLSADKTLVIEL